MQLLRANADAGIAHRELQFHPVASSLAGGGAGNRTSRKTLCLHANFHLALRGELHAVGHEVYQNLAQPGDVADHRLGCVRVELIKQVQAFFGRFGRQQIQRFLNASAQIKWTIFQVQFARFDFGEIEDVVNDREQRLATGAYHFHKIALIVLKLGLQQQTGHRDHPIHRGPYFMTHVGEKLRLGAGVFLGSQPRRFQIVVGASQLIDQPLAMKRCANPRRQLGRVARSGHVVPGAEFKAAQLEVKGGLRGDNNPGRIEARDVIVKLGQLIAGG